MGDKQWDFDIFKIKTSMSSLVYLQQYLGQVWSIPDYVVEVGQDPSTACPILFGTEVSFGPLLSWELERRDVCKALCV